MDIEQVNANVVKSVFIVLINNHKCITPILVRHCALHVGIIGG